VRVPYGFQPSDLLDGRGLTLTDLAAASAAYGLGRDTGLMLIGETQGRRLLLRAAMLQGGALERGGAPAALAWGARVLAVPLGVWSAVEGDLNRRGHLALGASVYTTSRATDIVACSGVDPLFDPGLIRGLEDRDGDGRIDGVRVVQAAGELHLAWRGVALSGEYFHRWERPDGTGERRWSNGGYVQASAFVLPRALEVAGRIGRTNLPLYVASAVERALAGRRRDEQALAMTAYLRGHDLKLQAEYAHLVDDDVRADPITGPPFDRTAHRLRLQAHLAF
jgi:hypothetical protein